MPWIRVSEKDLLQPSQKKSWEEKGIGFAIMLSPYALPEAVRGGYNQDRKVFEIRFRYLDEEKTKRRKIADHIEALEGVNSSRLMGIDVDVEKGNINVISLIIKTLEHEIETDQGISKENYGVAKQVLSSKQEQLLAGAGAL